jgi:hypothetical protein
VTADYFQRFGLFGVLVQKNAGPDDRIGLAGHQICRTRIEAMFGLENPGGELVLGVVGVHLDGLLKDDGAGVQAGIDEVNGSAGPPHTGREGLSLRMQARESRKKGWVDVQNGPAEAGNQLGREDAHVSGEADEIDCAAPDDLKHSGFVILPGQPSARNTNSLDTRALGYIEGAGTFDIREHQIDPVCCEGLLSRQECDQIATPPARENSDAFHASVTPPPATSSPRR